MARQDEQDELDQRTVDALIARMRKSPSTEIGGHIPIARHDHQPMPQGGEGDAWKEILESFGPVTAMDTDHRRLYDHCFARRDLGIQRYGQPLRRNDGRDHTQDLREELLDAAAYAWVLGKKHLTWKLLEMIEKEGLL